MCVDYDMLHDNKAILKDFAIFTGKNLCLSLNILPSNRILKQNAKLNLKVVVI